jgi:hypothetical protein
VQGQQPLAERLLAHERLELDHSFAGEAVLELRLQATLHRHEAQLLEPANLRLCERGVLDVGQRLAAPEGECLADAPLAEQPLKAIRVELSRVDPKHVAGAARLHPAAEELPELADVPVQRRLRGWRRRSAPELVDEPVDRDDLVAVDEQEREQRALLPAGKRERDTSLRDLERPQHSEFDCGHRPAARTVVDGGLRDQESAVQSRPVGGARRWGSSRAARR